MAYKDWLNEKAAQKDSTKNAGMGTAADIKPEDIPSPKAPTGGKTEGADTYEAWYDTQKAYYDKLYADTLAGIEANRQKTITDSAAARAKQVGTYGANAERLASMGLTGGGYSDYLTAQAHAAHRGDVQAANALAEQSKLTQKQGYEQSLMNLEGEKIKQEQAQAEAQRKTVKEYNSIVKAIEDDEYKSLGTLKNDAFVAGLSEEQINYLAKAQEDRWVQAIQAQLGSASQTDIGDGNVDLSLEAMTDDQIDAYVAADMISKESADSLKKQRTDWLVQEIRNNAMNSGDINTFQKNIKKYWDVLGDKLAKELNYEYNVKIAIDGLTAGTLQTEVDGVFSEAGDGYLDEKDAAVLGAYKVSHVAKQVYSPKNESVEKTQTGRYLYLTIGGTKVTAFSDGVSDGMAKALTEYAGNKAGTIVSTVGGGYVYDGEKWLEVDGIRSSNSENWTEKSYSLPQKSDTGYSKFLTE